MGQHIRPARVDICINYPTFIRSHREQVKNTVHDKESKVILCQTKTQRSEEQKERFNSFKNWRKSGLITAIYISLQE